MYACTYLSLYCTVRQGMPATFVTGVSPLGLFRTIPLGTYVYCVISTGVLPGLEKVVEVHGRVPQIVSDKSISLTLPT